jgi:WD40 repeat protein
MRRLVDNTNTPDHIAVSPRGDRFLSCGSDGILRLWSISGFRELFGLDHRSKILFADFVSNGSRVISYSEDGVLHLWDLSKKKELRRSPGSKRAFRSAAIIPNDSALLVGEEGGVLTIWDTRTLAPIRQISGLPQFNNNSLAVSRDSKKLVVGLNDRTIGLFDLDTKRRLDTFDHPAGSACLAFGPNDCFASGDYSGEILVFRADAPRPILRLKVPGDHTDHMVFSKDGRFLFSSHSVAHNAIRKWDLETGAEVLRFEGHSDSISGLAITPDGRFAISSGWDKSIRMWKLVH